MRTKKTNKNKLTPDEIHSSRDSLKHNPNKNISDAQKSIKLLLITDKEKIDSGLYHWVDVIPKYGKPYKALKKKENG
jgi:hypothetical protein